MKIHRQLVQRAKSKATQSCCRFKISAIGLNEKGQLVASATNEHKYVKSGGGLHAEEKLFKIARIKGIITIIICRIGRTNNLLPIKPCKRCQKIANNLNIKIYSVKTNET